MYAAPAAATELSNPSGFAAALPPASLMALTTMVSADRPTLQPNESAGSVLNAFAIGSAFQASPMRANTYAAPDSGVASPAPPAADALSSHGAPTAIRVPLAATL